MVSGVKFPLTPRSITTMRSTLTAVSVAGLVAIGAASADARPTEQTARINAAQHAATMRALGRHHADLRAGTTGTPGYDAGRPSTATAAAAARSAPRPIVRVVRAPAAHDGFDWADAGIGAGLAAGLMILAPALASGGRRSLARPARPRPGHARNG
jgi:hypothetical protein